jgi:8-oxo-dGTP pyrophosphatase MutT (NUDIX family)
MSENLAVDIRVPVGDGAFFHRVGAVIVRDGAVLLASNNRADYWYSVGGAIQLGESAFGALARECREELGDGFADGMKVGELAFVHENFFFLDEYDGAPAGKPIFCHEVGLYFWVTAPDDWKVEKTTQPEKFWSTSALGLVPPDEEFYEWVPISRLSQLKVFPTFFATELSHPWTGLVHHVDDETGLVGM